MNLPQEPMLGELKAMTANRALGCDFFEGVVMKRPLNNAAPLCDGGVPRGMQASVCGMSRNMSA
jgi:hypothetical protein